ncbi:hypothetical protein FOA52_012301 [Chlamydomonas sp. UWO 241]|nr:hypothetical protein FOA52_012301 [Chlamydomonas sp. UWO 241]
MAAVNVFGVCWYAKKRSDFRKKYNIKGSTAGDCCLSCFCGSCVLCQDTNQLMAEDKSYKVPMAELPN